MGIAAIANVIKDPLKMSNSISIKMLRANGAQLAAGAVLNRLTDAKIMPSKAKWLTGNASLALRSQRVLLRISL